MKRKLMLACFVIVLLMTAFYVTRHLTPDVEGTWHDPNGRTEMTFKGNQVVFIDITGTYAINKNKLIMTFGSKELIFRFKVKEDVLTLFTEDSTIKLVKQEEE